MEQIFMKKCMRHNHYYLLFFLFAALSPMPALSQTDDDKVVISKCEEVYQFVMKDGQPLVINTIDREYTSRSKLRQIVQPSIYYGNDITIDNASCSGMGKAIYKSITPDNVFFDDTKICFFNTYLDKEGKKVRTTFRRTFKDVKYLARVYLADDHFVQSKTLTFKLPASFDDFEIVEYYLPTNGSVKVSRTEERGNRVVTYTITNLPAIKSDPMSPTLTKTNPHVIIRGVFKDYHDLYHWSKTMSDVDCSIPNVDSLITAITQGCVTEYDHIRATYQWVQENIHYVAFEAGVSAHQPDRPSEVIRKRYGDCKGMSLLLKTLLCQQGFDARLTDVGTTDIPYTMSESPTLASVDHVICTLFQQGKTYYLDPTCRHIPLTHIPSHIQGSEALIEDGEQCILQTIPRLSVHASTDSLCYRYHLENGKLTGDAISTRSGDLKEFFLRQLEQTQLSDQIVFLSNSLNTDSHANSVSEVTWTNKEPQATTAILQGHIQNSHSVQMIGDEVFIEMNPHNNLFINKIDTTNRKNDYQLPFPCVVVRDVFLSLPDGYHLTNLPTGIKIQTSQGILFCSFTHEGNSIHYTERMEIHDPLIHLADIPLWNQSLVQWTDACNEQVILKKE